MHLVADKARTSILPDMKRVAAALGAKVAAPSGSSWLRMFVASAAEAHCPVLQLYAG